MLCQFVVTIASASYAENLEQRATAPRAVLIVFIAYFLEWRSCTGKTTSEQQEEAESCES